ncbi:heme exporter protein CcmD [Lysobacter sp. A378]
MSYLNYVIAGYAVFVLVLGWDFLASAWQLRRELRNARRRAARQAAGPGDQATSQSPISNELTR